LRLGQHPPAIDLLAHAVDDGGVFVLLLLAGNALVIAVAQFALLARASLPARLGGGGQKFRAAALVDDLVRGPAVGVDFPVLVWVVLGRIQNGLFKEGTGHGVWFRSIAIRRRRRCFVYRFRYPAANQQIRSATSS
jgi:hypothetical protein